MVVMKKDAEPHEEPRRRFESRRAGRRARLRDTSGRPLALLLLFCTAFGVAWFLAGARTAEAQAADPNETVPIEETLRGHRRMSVKLTGFDRLGVDVEPIRKRMVGELQAEGVEILPDGSFPMLALSTLHRCCMEVECRTFTQSDIGSYHLMNFALHFWQRVPLPNPDGTQSTSGRYVGAITWGDEGIYGVRKGDYSAIPRFVAPLIDSFMHDYRQENPRH